VHEIPLRVDGAQPRLSQLASPRDPSVTDFLGVRAAGTLTTSGMDVSFDPATSSPLPEILRRLLIDDEADLVGLSQEAGNYLFDAQGRNVSPGLLTMGVCEYDGKKGVLLTKLEKTKGVSISDATIDGKLQLSIGFQPNLMLTDATRIFKIALFL